jgi:hypothetical protein
VISLLKAERLQTTPSAALRHEDHIWITINKGAQAAAFLPSLLNLATMAAEIRFHLARAVG